MEQIIPETGKFEPTPLMIEAGLEILWAYDPDYSDGEETVRRLWAAMAGAEPERV